MTAAKVNNNKRILNSVFFLHCPICPRYVEIKFVEYKPGTNTMGDTP